MAGVSNTLEQVISSRLKAGKRRSTTDNTAIGKLEQERTEDLRISDSRCCVVSDFAVTGFWLMCLFILMVMFPFIRPSGLDLGPSSLGKRFKFFQCWRT